MKQAAVGSLVAIASLGLAYLGAPQRADAADWGTRPLLSPDSMRTGLYGGINVGGFSASGDAQWSALPSPAQFGAGAAPGSLSGGGFVTGFQGGYVVGVAPGLVAGIEADFAGSHATSSALSTWTAVGTNAPLAGYAKEIRTLNWLTTARGRIGYLVTPATLVYFTGGAAWSGVSYEGASAGPIGAAGYATSVSFFQTQSGYVLGGGIEFATWDRWMLRGEYLFHRFNDVSAVAPHFPNFPSAYSWTGFDVNEVRAAVSYKF